MTQAIDQIGKEKKVKNWNYFFKQLRNGNRVRIQKPEYEMLLDAMKASGEKYVVCESEKRVDIFEAAAAPKHFIAICEARVENNTESKIFYL